MYNDIIKEALFLQSTRSKPRFHFDKDGNMCIGEDVGMSDVLYVVKANRGDQDILVRFESADRAKELFYELLIDCTNVKMYREKTYTEIDMILEHA